MFELNKVSGFKNGDSPASSGQEKLSKRFTSFSQGNGVPLGLIMFSASRNAAKNLKGGSICSAWKLSKLE